MTSEALMDGDLLFRFMHSQDLNRPYKMPLYGTELYQEIIKCQMEQDVWHDLGYEWCANQNVDKCIFHVGIYADGNVFDIDKPGLLQNAVGKREHFDIVVRFPKEVAGSIGATAALVKALFKKVRSDGLIWYPFIREGVYVQKGKTESGAMRYRRPYKIPHEKEMQRLVPEDHGQRTHFLTGGWIPPDTLHVLQEEDRDLSTCEAHTFARPVVCSHFVAAVLYKAQCGGAFHNATAQRFDYIFKMTPSHLLKQCFTRQYLCKGAQTVGMQHQGNMYPEKDLGKLIVQGDYYCERLGFKPKAA